MKWTMFCKRTGDPKLAWIERELDKLGIPHRRNGHSFHAPILEVPEDREEEANSILKRRVGRFTIDDISDNHPRWRQAIEEANTESATCRTCGRKLETTLDFKRCVISAHDVPRRR